MNQPAQENGKGLMVQGRIVWTMGKDLFQGKALTDYNTGAVILDETGQPIIEYGFGLAVPKVDPRTGQFTPDYTALYQALQAEAFALYPQGAPKDFAFKVKDGDVDVDDKGVPYSKREGYAGHYVLACTTRIPIKFFIWQNGNNVVVNTGIKNGDYVNVQLNLKGHPPKGRGKAGIYTNPSAVQLITAGKEIINTPSGDQLFGQNAPAYSGQVEAHTAPTMPGVGAPQMTPPMAPPAAPQHQQAPAQPQYAPQPAYNPPAPQYDPYHGVLPPQHQPAPQAPVAPPQGMPQYPGNAHAPQVTPPPYNSGSMPVNGAPMNTGMNAPQNAYPSNTGIPQAPNFPMPGQR